MGVKDEDIAKWYNGLSAKDQRTLAEVLEFSDSPAEDQTERETLLDAAMDLLRSGRGDKAARLN